MAAKKKVPYRRLRDRMMSYGVSNAELAQALMIRPVTVSEKLNCRSEWTSAEMWRVMSYLQIPDDELYLYFPRGGKDVEDMRATGADAYLRSVNKTAVSDSSLQALWALVDGMRAEAM